MRWRVGILVVVALVLVMMALARPREPEARHDWSPRGMPVYSGNARIDPRMPVLDSVLPLRRDTARRRAAPLRGWR